MTEKKTKKAAESPVSFIEDPFQIQTLDITEAQNSSEAIDEGLEAEAEADLQSALTQAEEVSDSLQRLAASIAEQVAKDSDAQAALTAASSELDEQDPKALLEAQIAEDQALALQMEREHDQMEGMEEADEELQAALPSAPAELDDGTLDLAEMESCIEALLFISDKPLSLAKLHEHLGPELDKKLFKEALAGLQARYQANHHGIEVVEIGGGFQFRTRPGRAALARKLAKVQTQRLSSGAMETLAILAYRQPVMKEEIDKIRGVDSSYFIRGLLDRKLIKISGRSELPGRPMLYGTTDEFLAVFGLASLDAMPPLAELEAMVPASQANSQDEDPRVKEMRKLVGQMNADTSTSLKYDPKEDEKILAEIRERVSAIPTSTPTLDEQKAAEKAAKDEAKRIASGEPAQDLFEAAQPSDEAPAEATAELPAEEIPAAAMEAATPAESDPSEPQLS